MAVNSQKAKLACKWNTTHRIVWGVTFKTDVFVHVPGLSLDWWDSDCLLNNEASSQQEGTWLITVGEYLLRLSCSPFMTTMKYNCRYVHTSMPFSWHDKAVLILESLHVQVPHYYWWCILIISPTVYNSSPPAQQKGVWKYFGSAMEAWPVVAWALLMTSIADVLKSVHSRDFTMMDIIMLHPSSRNIILDS